MLIRVYWLTFLVQFLSITGRSGPRKWARILVFLRVQVRLAHLAHFLRQYLPKFKMTSEFQMNNVLTSMGIPSAFDARRADFSGMNGKKDLYISAVIHKAFVDVKEEGTEAAAATGIVMRASGMPDRIVFRADHPFVFFIRDNRTDSILFMGRVVNPKP